MYAEDGDGKYIPSTFFFGMRSPQEFQTYWGKYLEKREEAYLNTMEALTQVLNGSLIATTPEMGHVLSQGDVQRIVASGHSFGGAGWVRYIQKAVEKGNTELLPKGLLLWDPWLRPLKTVPEEDRQWDLGVSTIPWMMVVAGITVKSDKDWRKTMAGFSKVNHAARMVETQVIQDVSHQWISDVRFWMPHCILRRINLLGPGENDASIRASRELAAHGLHAALTSKTEDLNAVLDKHKGVLNLLCEYEEEEEEKKTE